MSPEPFILSIWFIVTSVLLLAGLVAAGLLWFASRPTFTSPRHRIRVFIKDPTIKLTPAQVDAAYDVVTNHAIEFFMHFTPPPEHRTVDRAQVVGTVRQTVVGLIEGTYVYLDTKNIVAPKWRKSYPRAKDPVSGKKLPPAENIDGLGYPGGVALKMENYRNINPDGLDYTLGTSALAHEHIEHRVFRELWGYDNRNHKSEAAREATKACRAELKEKGL